MTENFDSMEAFSSWKANLEHCAYAQFNFVTGTRQNESGEKVQYHHCHKYLENRRSITQETQKAMKRSKQLGHCCAAYIEVSFFCWHLRDVHCL